MDTEGESKFYMVAIRALECIETLFDHALGSSRPHGKRQYKSGLGWLHQNDFTIW